MNQELSTIDSLNSTALILTRISYQKDLASEMRDFAQIICQDIMVSNKLKENSATTQKLNMLMETIRCFVESFNNNINEDIAKKFDEYEELLYIQMKDKRVFKNEYELSLAEIRKELDSRDDDNVFNAANEAEDRRDRNESKQIMEKLMTFESETKELIQRLSQSKKPSEQQESELLQKIDFLVKKASTKEDEVEDKEIVQQFREIVNLNDTCHELHLRMTSGKKQLFDNSLERINSVIYQQLAPAFDQLKKDITTLYERLKSKVN